ncbi:MAG: radical SAM protein [Planctomycetes bacterium]|nr:radical SAM protein [Planctomycetota bacterium]
MPIYGTIELTRRCNLRCRHCYLGRSVCDPRARQKELSAQQFLSIIDQIVDAQCLDLLITGGEPLLRQDFGEIYQHAIEGGLLVTVFTNGTLITDETLDIFESLRPRGVEITLYGATETTYEKITRIPGSYRCCMEGIEKILDRGIRLALKTVLTTLNRHELTDMEDMARECGASFRFDAGISACLDGDKSPIYLRVPPDEAVEMEFSNPDRLRQRQEYFEKTRGNTWGEKLYGCSAGRNMFHIDPYGNMKPCLMTQGPQYSLVDGDFLTGWQDVLPTFQEKKARPDFACGPCQLKGLCDGCPAFFVLETGSEQKRSEYQCAMAHHRLQAIEAATVMSHAARS